MPTPAITEPALATGRLLTRVTTSPRRRPARSAGDPGAYFGFGVEGRFFPLEKIDEESAVPVVEAPKRVVVAANKVEIREKIQFKHNEAVIESASDSPAA